MTSTNSMLAVLLRRAQWQLDDVAHTLPSGGCGTEACEELADLLVVLASAVREHGRSTSTSPSEGAGHGLGAGPGVGEEAGQRAASDRHGRQGCQASRDVIDGQVSGTVESPQG